jgi:hypothetical protein
VFLFAIIIAGLLSGLTCNALTELQQSKIHLGLLKHFDFIADYLHIHKKSIKSALEKALSALSFLMYIHMYLDTYIVVQSLPSELSRGHRVVA